MDIQTLWPGHVIRTMFEEHEVLLGTLRELAQLDKRVANADALAIDDLTTLQRLAQRLLDAEPHHQREEEVLFVALEELGIEGPPAVMRREHEDLREKKRMLQILGVEAEELPFETVQERLHQTASYLVHMLTDHIGKENQILYPMALQHIDAEDWPDLKRACDAIGYCSFTPGITNDVDRPA